MAQDLFGDREAGTHHRFLPFPREALRVQDVTFGGDITAGQLRLLAKPRGSLLCGFSPQWN